MKHEIRSAAIAVQTSNDNAADGDIDSVTIGGYAAIFNSPTCIGDEWIEVMARGAFTDTLANGQDVLALYSHELERLLGRRSAGTLRLKEDSTG